MSEDTNKRIDNYMAKLDSVEKAIHELRNVLDDNNLFLYANVNEDSHVEVYLVDHDNKVYSEPRMPIGMYGYDVPLAKSLGYLDFDYEDDKEPMVLVDFSCSDDEMIDFLGIDHFYYYSLDSLKIETIRKYLWKVIEYMQNFNWNVNKAYVEFHLECDGKTYQYNGHHTNELIDIIEKFMRHVKEKWEEGDGY